MGRNKFSVTWVKSRRRRRKKKKKKKRKKTSTRINLVFNSPVIALSVVFPPMPARNPRVAFNAVGLANCGVTMNVVGWNWWSLT